MKRISFIATTFVIASFYSCDKIEGPTRENIAVDTTCEFVEDNSIPTKKVLVEDYTGHNCGNCPAGGVLLNDSLKTKYGDDIVVVSVHAGYFADVCPGGASCPPNYPNGAFATDYKSVCGEDWNTAFNVQFYPAGMIDRMDYPNNNLKPANSWDQKISERLNLSAKVRLRIQNTYDETARKVRACVETKFMEGMTGNYKLQVVLTEDSIVDWQVWYTHNPELVPDYVFHHVLRGSLNTSFGVNVANGSITAGTKVVNGYSTDINSGWNENHCAVVAFVYDATTYEVLQVAEAKIK